MHVANTKEMHGGGVDGPMLTVEHQKKLDLMYIWS